MRRRPFTALAGAHPGRVEAGLARAGATRHEFAVAVDAVLARLGPAAPPPWVLGVGKAAARHTNDIGAGFASGHFCSPHTSAASMAVRDRPWDDLVAVRLVVRDTEQDAHEAALTFAAWRARRDRGVNEAVADR